MHWACGLRHQEQAGITSALVIKDKPLKAVVTKDEITLREDFSEEEKPKRQRASSGKAVNYTEVDLGLTDAQCRELKQFYESKNPKKQNDVVAVAVVKIKIMIDKADFSVDEIFSALRLIGGIKTPKNLKAVISNMYQLGLADKVDGKLVVNYATEDRVNLQLPETVDER